MSEGLYVSFSNVDPRPNIREYLNRKTPSRVIVKDALTEIVEKLPGTMIFGGMLRDFALKNGRKFASDIDLVSMEESEKIYSVIKLFEPKQNKFGGYRFSVGRTVFDIWSFQDTWAFRQGYVEGREVEDLLKTTFFNVDAAAYDLSSGRFYCEDGWVSAIESRLLELNLPQNPSVNSMMKRAIKLACLKGFSVGPKLAKFLVQNMRLKDLDRIGSFFMIGLKKHVELGIDAPYCFEPQKKLLISD